MGRRVPHGKDMIVWNSNILHRSYEGNREICKLQSVLPAPHRFATAALQTYCPNCHNKSGAQNMLPMPFTEECNHFPLNSEKITKKSERFPEECNSNKGGR
jgi:hypothetical protein